MWFPGTDGSVAVLVIGTDGFGADTAIMGRPGHARRLRAVSRLHCGKLWVTPDLLDLFLYEHDTPLTGSAGQRWEKRLQAIAGTIFPAVSHDEVLEILRERRRASGHGQDPPGVRDCKIDWLFCTSPVSRCADLRGLRGGPLSASYRARACVRGEGRGPAVSQCRGAQGPAVLWQSYGETW